jgi:hypothetical protein
VEKISNQLLGNEISWITIRDRIEFLKNLERWKIGWEIAFKRNLSDSVLSRYFLETPLGNPTLIVGIHKGKVVASSALVPLSLKDPISSIKINYLQLIAAFILPGYSEGFNTYKKMIGLVKDELGHTNCKFILTFPNADVKNLTIRIGKFKSLDTGFFIRGKMDLKVINGFKAELEKSFFDKDFLDWRMCTDMFHQDGMVFKLFNGEKNLLDATSVPLLKNFEGLMPWWESWGDAPFSPIDDYRLNMCVYSLENIPTIKRSFLLSDVF